MVKTALEQSDGQFLNELHRIGPHTVPEICSAVGVTATAHLAAALPCRAVHGLGTLGWLAADVAPPPLTAGGTLILPGGPGLGLTPDGETP